MILQLQYKAAQEIAKTEFAQFIIDKQQIQANIFLNIQNILNISQKKYNEQKSTQEKTTKKEIIKKSNIDNNINQNNFLTKEIETTTSNFLSLLDEKIENQTQQIKNVNEENQNIRSYVLCAGKLFLLKKLNYINFNKLLENIDSTVLSNEKNKKRTIVNMLNSSVKEVFNQYNSCDEIYLILNKEPAFIDKILIDKIYLNYQNTIKEQQNITSIDIKSVNNSMIQSINSYDFNNLKNNKLIINNFDIFSKYKSQYSFIETLITGKINKVEGVFDLLITDRPFAQQSKEINDLLSSPSFSPFGVFFTRDNNNFINDYKQYDLQTEKDYNDKPYDLETKKNYLLQKLKENFNKNFTDNEVLIYKAVNLYNNYKINDDLLKFTYNDLFTQVISSITDPSLIEQLNKLNSQDQYFKNVFTIYFLLQNITKQYSITFKTDDKKINQIIDQIKVQQEQIQEQQIQNNQQQVLQQEQQIQNNQQQILQQEQQIQNNQQQILEQQIQIQNNKQQILQQQQQIQQQKK